MIIRVKSERGGKQLKGKIGFYIKSNKNVKFDEVIAGREVYIQDADIESQSTSTYIGFNYIQELFNQVTPRKRTVTGYVMIDEDGKYNTAAQNGLRLFKDNFSFGVNNVVDYALDTTTNKADYRSWDDTSPTFRKLMKDYGKRTTNTNDSKAYIDKIIDKETLIGTNNQTTDTQVTTGDIVTSTGLYELYANVVRPFVGKMIEEGDNYRNTTGYQNTDGNWKPRTHPTDPAQTQSVSYCFGCKQTIQEFIDTVSKYKAPHGIPTGYRGDVDDNSGNIGAASNKKKWPGLHDKNEYLVWRDTYLPTLTAAQQKDRDNVAVRNHPYHPDHWAGVDCSGFIQWMISYAQQNSVAGLKVNYSTNARRDALDHEDLFMVANNKDRVYYVTLEGFADGFTKHFKRGDLIEYDGHVSTVYSDRSSCNDKGDNCTYEIIHAYGVDSYKEPGPAGKEIFSRKVIKTKQNIGATPTGFGRIKLWD